MPTIIDELVAVFRIDTKQAAKDAQAAQAAVDSVKKTAKVGTADQERIEKSQEVSREKRRKERERKDKEEVREKKKGAQELSSNLETLGRQALGAFVGFEGLKGLVNFIGAVNTQTAALGRNAANIGTNVKDLNAVGNAVELIGGNADAAKASFSGLSAQITAFKTRGEVGPLLGLASNAGVYPRSADGSFKDPTVLLPQIIAGLKAQGFSRPDIYNLASGAGVGEDLLNLYLDPDSASLLARGKANVFANEERARRAQAAAANLTDIKQGVKHDYADFQDTALTDPLAAYKQALAFPIVGTIETSQRAYNYLKDKIGAPATVGVANNNPGNIRDKKGAFRQYLDAQAGFVALQGDIDYKIDRDGLNTSRKIINKYAPASDNNNVAAYLADIQKQTGLDPDQPITNRDQRLALADAMARHEQGPKGYAQLRALATPGAITDGGDTSHTSNVHIDKVEIATQAKDADAIAGDFFGAMQRKGALAAQTNQGMTP